MKSPLPAALVALVLGASVARADVPAANSTQCQGAAAGSACVTDDGAAGTCVAQLVSRFDYSEGVPPKTKQVELLLCVASASAAQATRAPTWLAGALLLLVMSGLIAVKLAGRRRSALA
ncbi:MAG: hypothetical protein IAE78_30590 [Myxococcus sp.]|nr:hypothetical protein [Myxococcus sp.]